MFGPSKNLGIDPFPNSVGHFETQWQPSWISNVSNTGFAPRIWQLSYRWCQPKTNDFCFWYACKIADGSRKLQKKTDWVVSKLTNWRRVYWETTSGIIQNLTNLSYRGCANLKISIFLLNMFVCMLIELENHKNLQDMCFWSWQFSQVNLLLL